jgi:Type II secretion system (T2SS), protein G
MKATYLVIALLLLAMCGCGEGSAAQARLDIKNLDRAVSAYKNTTGDWPAELATLTEPQPNGDRGFLTASALVDPWGRPYHYDRNNRHPDTDQPLIWSDGPTAGQAASKIDNWSVKGEVGGR